MRRALKIIGYSIGGFVLAVLLIYFGLRANARAQFDAAAKELPRLTAEAKSVGLPLTIQELLNERPVNDSENAAPEFLKACELLPDFARPHSFTPYSWAEELVIGKPEKKAQIQKDLAALKPFLNACRTVSAKRRFRGDVPAGANIEQSLLHSRIKNAVQCLAAQAVLQAQEGDLDGSLRSLQTGFRVTNYLADCHGHLAMRPWMNCHGRLARAGLLLLDRLPFTYLQRLRTITENEYGTLDPIWSYKGECAISLSRLDWALHDPSEWHELFDLMSLASTDSGIACMIAVHTVSKQDMAPGLKARFIEPYIKAMRAYNKTGSIESYCTEIDKTDAALTRMPDPSYLFARIAIPLHSSSLIYLRNDQWNREALLATIRAAEFRRANGRFPKTLSEAGIDLLDPFSGSVAGYRTDATHAYIYSVGRDKTDNGGIPGKSDDIIFSYPAVIVKR